MIDHLIEKGSELAAKLEEKASGYHVKSGTNELFSWEAVGIRTRVTALMEGDFEARKDSSYKDIEWGSKLHQYSPTLSEEVRSFYKEYYTV